MTAVRGSPAPSSKPSAARGALRRVDERARARRRRGVPASSSSPSNTTVDVHPVELPGVLQRSQRVKENDVAALHVDDARAARGRVVQPLELLKRTARLEHRIEVADEQYLWPGARMLGDEWPARWNAAPSTQRVVNPSASNCGAQHVAHLPHAGEVHRAAVDVHDSLEQRQRLGVVRVDGAGDRIARST